MSDNPEVQIHVGDEHDDAFADNKELQRKSSKNSGKSGGGHLNLDAQSDRASQRRLSNRGSSFVKGGGSDFADDVEREKTHLRDANSTLDEQIAKMRQQVQELRSEGLTKTERKSLEDIEADNDAVRKEIAVLRGKLGQASNIELLDKLTDELAARQVDLKSVEVRVKNLSDENFLNAKLVRKEDGTSPQAVFLDMKADRRRHQKQLDKTRSRIDKSKEAHKAIADRLQGMEEEETSLGLHEISHDEIINTQKASETNEKELDKLRRKLLSFEGTITARRMQTARKSQNLCEEIIELQTQVRGLEAQVMKLEATIMSNQGLKTKPPHFLEPMEMTAPRPKAMPGDDPNKSMSNTYTSPAKPAAPRGPPPSSSPRQQQQQKQMSESNASSTASPPKKTAAAAPPPKKTAAAPPKAEPKKEKKEDTAASPSSSTTVVAAPAAASKKEPETTTSSSAQQEQRSNSDTRLNDLDDDRSPTPRSPTPPARTPTPPAATTEEAAPAKTPTPPPGSRPTSARDAPPPAAPAGNDEDDGYGDEGFDDSPKKKENDEPAFLTE